MAEEVKNNNFTKYMSNPKSFTIKQWLSQLLQENYSHHDQTAERVAASLLTEQDLEDFGKLLTQVYEKGYRKAVEDYKHQVEKFGIQVTIGPEKD